MVAERLVLLQRAYPGMAIQELRLLSNEAVDAMCAAIEIKDRQDVLQSARALALDRNNAAQILGEITVLRSGIQEDLDDVVLQSSLESSSDMLGSAVHAISDKDIENIGFEVRDKENK